MLVQYLKINQYNSQRKKISYDHLKNAENSFDKPQHSFMISILEKPGKEDNYLNLIKRDRQKSIGNVTFSVED